MSSSVSGKRVYEISDNNTGYNTRSSKRYKQTNVFQKAQKDIKEWAEQINNTLCSNSIDVDSLSTIIKDIPEERLEKIITAVSNHDKFDSIYNLEPVLRLYNLIPESVWHKVDKNKCDHWTVELLVKLLNKRPLSERSDIISQMDTIFSSFPYYSYRIFECLFLMPRDRELNIIILINAIKRLKDKISYKLILSILLTPDYKLDKIDQVTLFRDHLEKLIEMNDYDFLISFLKGSIRDLFDLEDSDPLIKKAYSHIWHHFADRFKEEIDDKDFYFALNYIPPDLDPHKIYEFPNKRFRAKNISTLLRLLPPGDLEVASSLKKIMLPLNGIIEILENTPQNMRKKVITILKEITENLKFNYAAKDLYKVFLAIPNLYELDLKKIQEAFQKSPDKINDPTFILTTLLPPLENNEAGLNRLIELNHYEFLNSLINGEIRIHYNLYRDDPLVKVAEYQLYHHCFDKIKPNYFRNLFNKIQLMGLDSQTNCKKINGAYVGIQKDYASYLSNYAQSIKNSTLLKIANQLENVVFLQQTGYELNGYEPNSTPKLVQGGTNAHAVLYSTVDEPDGTLSFTIYNSGDGAYLKQESGRYLCAPLKYSRLKRAQLNGEFFAKLNEYAQKDIPFSEVLSYINRHLSNGTTSTPTWHKLQKTGSCSFKSLSQYVSSMTKLLGETSNYKGFKVFLTKSLIQELWHLPNNVSYKIETFESSLFLNNGLADTISPEEFKEIKEELEKAFLKRSNKYSLHSASDFTKNSLNTTVSKLINLFF